MISRYEKLRSTLTETISKGGDLLSVRKQFEKDQLRLEQWRKKTGDACVADLRLDADVVELTEQVAYLVRY